MTLQECYAALGGDYGDVSGRLRSETMIQKFMLKFLDDGSYSLLRASLEKEDYAEAFRAAHTLKGVCLNLGFTPLFRSSSALCEALRDGYHPEADGLAAQVDADYQRTAGAIRAFRDGLPG